jgi:[Skp1-protein]-hydroxyproline N-acetylglucosaminyltransferase
MLYLCINKHKSIIMFELFSPSLFSIIIVTIILVGIYQIWSWYKQFQKTQYKRTIDQQCEIAMGGGEGRRNPNGNTIFVSIASYRDEECAKTIFDLFEKAYCPFRITVGVCEQNYPTDDDVLESYRKLAQSGISDFSDRIRIIRLSADEAKGPMYARHLIETQLFRGESFYLVTDSHMMFTPHWDKKLIDEWNMCLQWSEKPILTTYPDDFKSHHRTWPPSGYDNRNGSYLRFKKFNDSTGLVEIEGPQFLRRPTAPVKGLFWAGGLSFGASSIINEVPFDPFCPYAFLGEEISMAARLWTHGYDFYHPTTMIMYHMWERTNRPTFWQQFDHAKDKIHRERRKQEKESYTRLQKLLGIVSGSTVVAPYGLGSHRPLNEYEKLIGINMATKQITSLAGIIGVPDKSPASDILCRFGTWKNFEQAKNLLSRR